VERLCAEELDSVGLLPSAPEPIRIDRFIEKRFGITPEYAELPHGVLGYSRFSRAGVVEIAVARALGNDSSRIAERRVSTTLAHEAGHCLLHAHLFAFEEPPSLFGSPDDPGRILCRDESTHSITSRKSYDGRWWEFQANQAMAALLLPRRLVRIALEPFVGPQSPLGGDVLPNSMREEAAATLADIFEVNTVVARIRVDEVCPARGGQLTF